jgi:hypothetical protein
MAYLFLGIKLLPGTSPVPRNRSDVPRNAKIVPGNILAPRNAENVPAHLLMRGNPPPEGTCSLPREPLLPPPPRFRDGLEGVPEIPYRGRSKDTFGNRFEVYL